MAKGDPKKAQHDEVDQFKNSEQSDNPVASALNLTVSVPEAIEIKMVDASVLADFEVWFFISSILSSATIGFFVAYLQSEDDTALLINAFIFLLLFVITLSMTFYKRYKLRKKSKKITLKATEVVTKEG